MRLEVYKNIPMEFKLIALLISLLSMLYHIYDVGIKHLFKLNDIQKFRLVFLSSFMVIAIMTQVVDCIYESTSTLLIANYLCSVEYHFGCISIIRGCIVSGEKKTTIINENDKESNKDGEDEELLNLSDVEIDDISMEIDASQKLINESELDIDHVRMEVETRKKLIDETKVDMGSVLAMDYLKKAFIGVLECMIFFLPFLCREMKLKTVLPFALLTIFFVAVKLYIKRQENLFACIFKIRSCIINATVVTAFELYKYEGQWLLVSEIIKLMRGLILIISYILEKHQII